MDDFSAPSLIFRPVILILNHTNNVTQRQAHARRCVTFPSNLRRLVRNLRCRVIFPPMRDLKVNPTESEHRGNYRGNYETLSRAIMSHTGICAARKSLVKPLRVSLSHYSPKASAEKRSLSCFQHHVLSSRASWRFEGALTKGHCISRTFVKSRRIDGGSKNRVGLCLIPNAEEWDRSNRSRSLAVAISRSRL